MSELSYWKLSTEARYILKEVEEKRVNVINELGHGSLLTHQHSDHLAREYARKIGFLEGLKYLEDIFHNDRTDREEE